MHVAPQHDLRCGGHVENNHEFVERWVPHEDQQARSPSLHHESPDVRLEVPNHDMHHEAEQE